MVKINEFDLAFVVDTTSSMGGLIAAAQRQMIDMIDALSHSATVDMRLGIVEYRDHPPQDTLVSRVHPFTGNLKSAKRTINKLSVDGGGDEPEAVFAGLVAASGHLKWRTHARRIAVLVGDAPPHGVGCRGDAFREGCPSGETIHSTSAKLETARVRLYALGLTRGVTESFSLLSSLTGGEFFASGLGDTAISKLKEILQAEFGQLEFDRQVHAAWTSLADATVDSVAERLQVKPAQVAAAASRLTCRDLLEIN